MFPIAPLKPHISQTAWVNTTSAMSADRQGPLSLSVSFQKNCPPRRSVTVRTPPRGSDTVRTPPRGSVRVSTPPCGSYRVRVRVSASFPKKIRLVGRLGSGPRLVADRADVDTRPENVAGGAGRLNDSQKLLVPPSAAIY